MSEQSQSPQEPASITDQLRALSTCIAQSIEINLHFGRGDDSLFTSGVFGIVYLLMFEFWMVMFLPHDNPYPLLAFTLWTSALCVVHRLNVALRRRFGLALVRGRYSGRPVLSLILPFAEGTIKSLEPWFVLAAGIGVYRFASRPLGLYLLLGAIMLMIYVRRASLREWREQAS